jgi:hypothetical protein
MKICSKLIGKSNFSNFTFWKIEQFGMNKGYKKKQPQKSENFTKSSRKILFEFFVPFCGCFSYPKLRLIYRDWLNDKARSDLIIFTFPDDCYLLNRHISDSFVFVAQI